MRKSLLFITAALFCLLLSGTCAFAGPLEDANTAYQAGDFKKAEKLYTEALGAKKSAAVYYNLGNNYFRQGQKAKAVIHFERALALSPRDKDILWNRNLAKSVLVDQSESSNDALLLFWIKKITGFFTVDELAVLFSVGFIKLLLFGVLGFLFIKWKKLWRFLQGLCVVYLIVSGVLLAVKWSEVKDPRVIITDKEVYARFGPSNTEAKAFMLHEGAEAKIADESTYWYYVRYSNSSSGWIPKTACEVI